MSEETIEAIKRLANAIEEYTNEIKKQNPNRLLSVKEVKKEYGINERTVYKIFNSPDVITNRVSKAKKIKNSELWKFFNTKHEAL